MRELRGTMRIGAISRKGKRARRCAHRSGRQVARRHHGTLLHAEARGSSRGPVNPVFSTSVAAPGWNPASTFIRLRHRKNSLARHGRGAEQGAETRTSRGVPFAGRRRLSRPARHLSTLRTDGGRAQRSGGKGTAITLQVYCDAPALETRTPTASQRHRPRGTRPRPSAVRAAHCTESTYGVVVARPSGTQRAEKAALTCDGAVKYSFTTQHTKDETIRAPPTRTRHRRTPTLPHTRRAAHGERGIRVNPHMNRAKAAGQKPMFAFFSKICEPAREPRKMPTSIESRSAPVSRDERRRGRSTACVTQRRPCSPSRSHGGPTPHARSDWTML